MGPTAPLPKLSAVMAGPVGLEARAVTPATSVTAVTAARVATARTVPSEGSPLLAATVGLVAPVVGLVAPAEHFWATAGTAEPAAKVGLAGAAAPAAAAGLVDTAGRAATPG